MAKIFRSTVVKALIQSEECKGHESVLQDYPCCVPSYAREPNSATMNDGNDFLGTNEGLKIVCGGRPSLLQVLTNH